jgi:hypothetical protein
MTPQLDETFAKLGEADVIEDQTVRMLFPAPGFSLTCGLVQDRLSPASAQPGRRLPLQYHRRQPDLGA